ncbi:MAG: hypothetical protein IJA50_03735 [Firmicutes bacterium]|nr:hypothetical protein [Bacillota bacterium]
MLNERELVEQTENVEGQTTEEIVDGETAAEEEVVEKTFTPEEVDEIVAKKVGRTKAKMKREFERELAAYKEAEMVLNSGLQTSNITDATQKMREFYEEQGVTIPARPQYSNEDLKVLAANEAQKIIELGLDEVIEEVDRLANKNERTAREDILFTQLAEYRQKEAEKSELAKIGVKPEALDDRDFREFQKNLNPKMPLKEQYEMYLKFKPKAKVEPIGSMKGTKAEESAVKDHYSYEEAMKFTKEDFDKNPALFKAVEKSMRKW